MILTKEQAEERLKNENNLANRFSSGKVIDLPRKGKKKDEGNLTEIERNEIAVRARLGESQQVLAEEFDTRPANISHIKLGKTKGIDEEKVEQQVNAVKDKALERLMKSLGLLDDDKLSKCSAKDLSVIASNMGRVYEKTTSQREASPTQVIIYAPQLRDENRFKTIEV